jgi:hypothetical protein
MIKVVGVGFNGTILICLFLHFILRKFGTHSTEVSLPTYLQGNKCALILVVHLCIIDLGSVVVLYFILPALLSSELSTAETCAWKIPAFCFINLGTTLSTFCLALERWIKIAHFERNGRKEMLHYLEVVSVNINVKNIHKLYLCPHDIISMAINTILQCSGLCLNS